MFKFEPLGLEDIKKIINHAIHDTKNGLGLYKINISDEVIEYAANLSAGDVRTALNGVELAVITTKMDDTGCVNITKEIIADSMQQKKMHYDKNSNEHYDTISAFIKSMRGSDVDATLIYLAKMIAAGEDPKFIARRIVICAAEDVGLANPNALVVANAAMQAVANIGMPEGRIILSEAAVYVAKSKKSNSVYLGIDNALNEVENGDIGEIPMHIRNAPIEDMKKHGYSNGYKYPHDFDGGFVEQQYLPDKIKTKKYYTPKSWEVI